MIVYITLKIIKYNLSAFESAMVYGQLTVALVIASLSFGVWQAWWMSTLWLSASLMVLALKSDPKVTN